MALPGVLRRPRQVLGEVCQPPRRHHARRGGSAHRGRDARKDERRFGDNIVTIQGKGYEHAPMLSVKILRRRTVAVSQTVLAP